jgi:hypothetical protein
MNLDQAITIVEQALNIAAKQGCFNLNDSATVNTALSVLVAMKTKKTEEDTQEDTSEA